MRFDFRSLTFEDAAVEPAKLAVSGSDGDISWMDLEREVARFSNLFRSLNIPRGHPVLLRGHKELRFPAAMLAAVQCSLPYVPIDTMAPDGRVRKIVETTGSQVLVDFGGSDGGLELPIEIRASDFHATRNAEPDFNPANTFWFPGDPLFYIMFTSGSTGAPKGVQITHGAVLSFLDWMRVDYGLRSEDRFINQAPFSFDLSVYELLFSFCLGGSLILNPADLSNNTALFVERIKKYSGSVWVSTPSFVYRFLLEPSFIRRNLPELRTFLFCGEELPNRTARRLLELFPDTRVLNSYGPTEATVSTTLVNIDEAITREFASLPVGSPKYTSEILIENEEMDPSRPGEIIIAGDNVSIGYLKDPQLTKEKFFLHNGKRAYRTGDYGHMKNGMLFFGGRRDEQVKLHGYRIELSDINSQITAVPFVDQAVTVPLRDGNTVRRIISFVKLKESIDETVAGEIIISELKKHLPPYMIPGEVRIMHDFSYSGNHKIDKKKLIDWYCRGGL